MSERIFEYREEFNITDIAGKYAERVSRVIDEQTLAMVESQLAEYGYVKVVRCRDCEHGIKADLSGNWYECMKPDGNGDYARWDVEPDGFCSWAERKEGGDD